MAVNNVGIILKIGCTAPAIAKTQRDISISAGCKQEANCKLRRSICNTQ